MCNFIFELWCIVIIGRFNSGSKLVFFACWADRTWLNCRYRVILNRCSLYIFILMWMYICIAPQHELTSVALRRGLCLSYRITEFYLPPIQFIPASAKWWLVFYICNLQQQSPTVKSCFKYHRPQKDGSVCQVCLYQMSILGPMHECQESWRLKILC